jgi:hypothetical protein
MKLNAWVKFNDIKSVILLIFLFLSTLTVYIPLAL